MAHLLMIAHDPGGANILTAIAALLRKSHHQLSWCAAGPALALWRESGFDPIAISGDADLSEQFARRRPDLLITGTSAVADLERLAWARARRSNVASLAVFDAWMNYRRRATMTVTGEIVQPNAIAVADEAMRRGLAAQALTPARIYEVGQPHLEALVRRLTMRRASCLRGGRPLLAFFSEGIFEERSFGCLPGYDQFTTMSSLLKELQPSFELEVAIMPHPLEGVALWRQFVVDAKRSDNVLLSLGERDRDSALCQTSGVIGMTSMVLVEAALLGVPVLSLQLERRENDNPILDEFPGIAVVTASFDLPASLDRFLSTLDGAPDVSPVAVTTHAAERLVAAIESELTLAERGASY
jgi:hypothetical protein